MPHIQLEAGLPGMRALQSFRPETATPMNQLANILLRGPSTLSRGERELIGSVVSSRNDCDYCASIHGAVAASQLGDDNVVGHATRDFENASLTKKVKALLAIAVQVQQSGRSVSAEAVARARTAGATDLEIHDTVLIAAAFCMFNRYVDGLGAWAPEDPKYYRDRGAYLARHGYGAPESPPRS